MVVHSGHCIAVCWFKGTEKGGMRPAPLPEIKLVPLRFFFALEVKLITVFSTEVFAGFL